MAKMSIREAFRRAKALEAAKLSVELSQLDGLGLDAVETLRKSQSASEENPPLINSFIEKSDSTKNLNTKLTLVEFVFIFTGFLYSIGIQIDANLPLFNLKESGLVREITIFCATALIVANLLLNIKRTVMKSIIKVYLIQKSSIRLYDLYSFLFTEEIEFLTRSVKSLSVRIKKGTHLGGSIVTIILMIIFLLFLFLLMMLIPFMYCYTLFSIHDSPVVPNPYNNIMCILFLSISTICICISMLVVHSEKRISAKKLYKFIFAESNDNSRYGKRPTSIFKERRESLWSRKPRR